MKILPDLILIAGAVSVSAGAWMAWEPAGLLALGAMLIAAGLQMARAG